MFQEINTTAERIIQIIDDSKCSRQYKYSTLQIMDDCYPISREEWLQLEW